jgi:hypothetical protein
MVLLGIWLIAQGVLPWLPAIHAGEAVAILGIIAGVLILLGR